MHTQSFFGYIFKLLALFLLTQPLLGQELMIDKPDPKKYIIEGSINQRIVSLSPIITQIMYDIKAEYQLKGKTDMGSQPKNEAPIPSVGGVTINIKTVISLKPDKVLAMENREALKIEFDLAGLEYRVFKQPRTMRGILQLILEVGAAVDELQKAQELVQELKTAMQNFLQAPITFEKKKVLLVFWPKPLVGIGNGHFAAEMLSYAGGHNVLDINQPFVEVSNEDLLRYDPDIIILTNPTDKAAVESHPLIPFKNDGSKRLIVDHINPIYFLMPGPRFINGIKDLHRLFIRQD